MTGTINEGTESDAGRAARRVAYLVVGPLADRVFEPARRLPLWRQVAWLVGAGQGAGIGLMFVIAGALALCLSFAFYGVPAIRRMETTLPDHRPTVEPA